MPVEIHGMQVSAPCRIVYMTVEALGLEVTKVDVNIFEGGAKTPEYTKVLK
jgi:glutathione S-transferase